MELIMIGWYKFVDKIQFCSKHDKLDYILLAGLSMCEILSINTEPTSIADVLSPAEGTIRLSPTTMTWRPTSWPWWIPMTYFIIMTNTK
jgi:hypothetical protein